MIKVAITLAVFGASIQAQGAVLPPSATAQSANPIVQWSPKILYIAGISPVTSKQTAAVSSAFGQLRTDRILILEPIH